MRMSLVHAHKPTNACAHEYIAHLNRGVACSFRSERGKREEQSWREAHARAELDTARACAPVCDHIANTE
jgi:hypothetical protein